MKRFKEIAYEVHFSVVVRQEADETKVYENLQRVIASALKGCVISEHDEAVSLPMLVRVSPEGEKP
jgi:hypothetical protein